MLGTYDVESRQEKVKKDRRVISLRPIDNKKPLTTSGAIDSRLFTGENQLVAIYDTASGMWSARYTIGATPMGLQQRFTLFNELVEYLRQFYRLRNVEISGIKD